MPLTRDGVRRCGATSTRRLRRGLALAATLFLFVHLPFLASGLDDIDSVNFALGIRRFDPVRHRPHPPGYPIYIAIGKAGTYALDTLRPSAAAGAPIDAGRPASPRGNEATVLAFWSALFGALAIWPLFSLFRALDIGRRRWADVGGPGQDGIARPGPDAGAAGVPVAIPAAATLLTVVCPLYWFTAVRPMSDLAGFATALVAQALLVNAFTWQGRRDGTGGLAHDPAASGRLIVAGAFAAAIALGFRSQAGWLTLPLLAVVLFDRAGRGAAAAVLGSAVSFGVGVLLWAVPLVVATGGLGRYIRATFEQAGEDFNGIDMFMNFPSARRFVFGLVHTFVLPWGWTPVAVIVLALASLGSAAMLWRSRPSLGLLIAAVGPYTVFHLLVQETITTRYALPVLPAVTYLAVRGLALAGRRAVLLGAAALAVPLLILTVPATRAYAAEPSPLGRALDDMERQARSAPPGALAMHQVFARGVEAAAPRIATTLAAPPRHEWMELARYWQSGGRGPVWFLADPRRTDLSLVDHASRHALRLYDWRFPAARVMSGVRPDAVEWQVIDRPGWFALDGWSLTPETAGVAREDAVAIGARPITAWVRHRPENAVLMLGGRNLAGAGGATAVIEARVADRVLGRWVVEPGPRFFLEFADIPAGALDGAGDYGPLSLTAAPAVPGGPATNVAIEQFDLQPPGQPMLGFGAGWHEQEYSLAQGRAWHWASESSVLAVRHGGHDLVLRLAGESPLRYFDAPPAVVLRAGAAVLSRFSPASDFSRDIAVPRAALDASDGRLTLETNRVFVPNDRSGNGDLRHLGLRMYDVSIRPR